MTRGVEAIITEAKGRWNYMDALIVRPRRRTEARSDRARGGPERTAARLSRPAIFIMDY